MSNKSEALKLADVVDEFDVQSEHMPLELYSDISSELRRLHEVNQELLEACMVMIEWDDREKDHAVDFYKRTELCEIAFQKARAAIAKSTGERT